MILILAFIVNLLWLIQYINAQTAQNWVYSSQYDYIIPITETQGLYNSIKVAYKANLIFLAAGTSGVKVIDPKQNYQVTSVFKSDEYVEGFSMTQDANYVFIPYNKKLTIFDFSSRTQFKQIAQDSAQIQNVDMILNNAESIVFIFQANGQIRAVNISNKQNPTFAGSTSWHNSEIYNGFISQDDKWLFVCQGFQGLGVYQITYNVDGTVSFFLAGAFLGSLSGSYAVDLTSDLKYIINIDNKRGVSIADFTQITNAGGVYKSATYLVTIWWPTAITLPSPYSLCISKDNNFLFLGVLSQGIYIVDITDKANPNLYEVIQVFYQGKSIKLSSDESFLYYANGQSLQIFPKTSPSLNNQYLNMFNTHLATTYDWSTTYFYWRCVIDDSTKLYYGSFDDDGLWIIDASVPQNMQVKVQQFKPPTSAANIDIVVFLKGFQYVIIPTIDGTNVFAVYATNDIITKQALATPVQLVPYQTDNYIVDSDYDETINLLIGALGNSIIFLDITTVGSYFVKTVWQFTPDMKGSCTGVMFTNAFKYIIGASRGFGYFVLDITNLQNIQMVQYINSLGAENLFQSTISNNYGFFVDGLQGIFIVNFANLPQISYFSQIQILGWSNDITFVNNEKLLLVSTLEQGMVTMVDISDIHNPFIVSDYYYENQNGMSTCAFEDNSYIFINNNIGVISLPTIGQVEMHVEIAQILGYSSIAQDFIFQKMKISDIFTVGMNIQVDIVFLYQPLDLIIDSIWLYQSEIMYPIPTWMTYDPEAVSINIQVVKDAIDPKNMTLPLLNTILLKTLNPLYQIDFNYNNAACLTTSTQNQAIYNYLLANGYISDQNIVNPNLSFTAQQQLTVFPSLTNSFNKCISDMIKQTLLNSIQFAPIYLFFQTSLIYIQNPPDQLTYIKTVATEVSVNVIVPKFSGQFIYENQIGVNISINSDKNDILISGLIDNVNFYLSNILVLYAMNGNQYSKIQASLVISDGINYDLSYDVLLSQISFMKEKSPVQKNTQLLIQSQFNSAYASGDLQILTDFTFIFDQSTFISPDVGQVTYTAYIQQQGQFVLLDTSHWIQYYAEGYKFYGTPPESAYEQSITIQLLGTDGYSTCSDTFVITVNQLPALFVIQWIAQVLGPIIGALGMYKYRNIFYNAFFKHKNRYSKVNVQVNEKFILKIPLISQDLKQAKDMIENLIENVQKEKNGKTEKVDLQKLAKMTTLKIDDIENNEAIKREEEDQQREAFKMQELEQNLQFYQIPNSQQNDQDLINSNNVQTQKVTPIKHHNFNTDKNDITNQFKDKLALTKNNPRNSTLEKEYLDQDGKIKMQSITNDMLKYNVKFEIVGKQLEAKAYKQELTNPDSSLYKCIKYLFSRYFIQLDKKTHLVSEYIRYFGKKNCFLHTQNDWYKQFTKIISEDKLDIYGQTIACPKIQLIYNNIISALISLDLFTSKLENFNTLSQKGVNPYLVKQVLKADALGIDFNPPSSLFPSQGECIHIKPSDLRSVESFKYAPGGYCFSLKKYMNMEYDPYGPKENMQFPNWLELIMQSGVIILTGTPQQQDIEEILIRFYGLQGYIYRSFTLRVQDIEGTYQKSRVESLQKQKKQADSIQGEEQSKLLNIDNQQFDQNQFNEDFNMKPIQTKNFDSEDKINQKNIRLSNFARSPLIENQATQIFGTPQMMDSNQKIIDLQNNIESINLNN
ncbi:calpain family cysteine protease (macronuclear) [Tetrahymena thermophila SB210]|uniref:Calpain family cysteine protease n=1 Tax=Tetrahymena thermophila (strain SB210) TaxID=312017 RepID=Q229Q1_TETTS|nr:calpain family cysteine protease [Tetrahymena thermophila SB210]EAR82021.2 calpain family cysteine protease [Tetrahymena thermophila SB210]|eukprot:XP_001029684.2 calpain family cysteine protease [Tetrahymena thermophila SB210]